MGGERRRLIRLLYYLPMEMTKKEEKKSELEQIKELEERVDKLERVIIRILYKQELFDGKIFKKDSTTKDAT